MNYEIFNYLDDYSLVEICRSNKHYYSLCKNTPYYNRILGYLEKRKELQQIVMNWNKNNDYPIDLKKYKKNEELIILLWERDINFTGFGEPYDKALKNWAIHEEFDGENSVYRYKNNHNRLYQVYMNSDKLYDFLYYTLCLPKKYGYFSLAEKLKQTENLSRFNKFWTLMNKPTISSYDELRIILKNKELSPIQLCYLFYEADNYGIYSDNNGIFDFYDNIGL